MLRQKIFRNSIPVVASSFIGAYSPEYWPNVMTRKLVSEPNQRQGRETMLQRFLPLTIQFQANGCIVECLSDRAFEMSQSPTRPSSGRRLSTPGSAKYSTQNDSDAKSRETVSPMSLFTLHTLTIPFSRSYWQTFPGILFIRRKIWRSVYRKQF